MPQFNCKHLKSLPIGTGTRQVISRSVLSLVRTNFFWVIAFNNERHLLDLVLMYCVGVDYIKSTNFCALNWCFSSTEIALGLTKFWGTRTNKTRLLSAGNWIESYNFDFSELGTRVFSKQCPKMRWKHIVWRYISCCALLWSLKVCIP